MTGERPEDIDVIKYTDPMLDTNHGRSLVELIFYDNENIKITRKAVKPIPKEDLFNEDTSDVSPKFERIITLLFHAYKSKEVDGLRPEDLERLSKEKWRGSLFKERARLDKVFEDHDKEKKGYLNYDDFKNFFFVKASKNLSAVWILINLSGFRNNLKAVGGQE